MKAEPIAGELARFVEALGIDNIPPEVALRARYLILDAIGCAMAARREEFATRFWSATKALTGDTSGTAGVIGYADRVPLRDAAVLNGVLMHGLDYDDTHLAGVIHLTVAVLPAVLNLASHRKLSGADLLVAYIAGVETGARIAMAARSGIHAQGFHTTAVVGTFAAAWAAGRLMRLDASQLVQAQGAALSMAAGSLQFIEDGGWTKRLHADRVRYVVDPDSTFPRGYGGEVRVTLADGTHHRHREALNRGSAEIPLSNAEVRDKFMDNATLHFSLAHARAVCELVLGLDHLPAASALEDLLAREPVSTEKIVKRAIKEPNVKVEQET